MPLLLLVVATDSNDQKQTLRVQPKTTKINARKRPSAAEFLRRMEAISIVFSHIFVGVSDFERALGFYNPLMSALGIQPRFCDRERPWAGWQSSPDPRPLYIIGAPQDKLAHESGNGQMVAFLAASRADVEKAHAVALANGGTSEGAPGLRPEYHEHYYGAYFRDPDGNKLCVACHLPAG